jgi:phospholipid transport system substrate-binding protein
MAAVTTPNCVRLCAAATAAFALLCFLGRGPVPANCATPATGASINDPVTVLKTGINDVLAVFRDKQMPLAERRARLRALAGLYFDFDDMARSALGYHWRDLTPDKRAEFVPIFSDFIENAYLSKLQDSGVEKIRQEATTANIRYTRQTIDGDYAEVFSTVALEGQKEPIEIDYMMHLKDGKWRIYDVTVDAISVVGNYRSQFNRVINNEGYDKLIADLMAKTRQLQAYMDRPSAPASP